MKLLYIHGLASSGNSSTAKTLQKLLSNVQVIAPDLPINPILALESLQNICQTECPDIIIGTSMGGMFAQKLRGYKKILVNPAFHVSEFMRKNMGVQHFFNQRKDGIQTFEITSERCDAYENLEKTQFENLEKQEKEITWALFGENDEQVNCFVEYNTYYNQYQFFDGGHRLSQSIIEKVLIPLIQNVLSIKTAIEKCPPLYDYFKNRQIELPGFIRDVEQGEKMDKMEILKILTNQYIEYCGISLGYRTVIWDIGWNILDIFIQSPENNIFDPKGYTSFADAFAVINPDASDIWEEYDIGIIDSIEEYIEIGFQLLAETNEKTAKYAISYGLFLFAPEDLQLL